MMAEFLKKIRGEYASQLELQTPTNRENAQTMYKELAKELRNRPVTGRDLMGENSRRLVTRIRPQNIGRLCMFYYYPKLREKLPYYDRFPLIMPIEIYDDGFLGINFHYLPHRQRAKLLDLIDQNVLKGKHLSERKQISISYHILKRAIRHPSFMPCIKRYLYSHLRSKIYRVEPKDWNIVLFLPLERFEKASAAKVHIESMRKIRSYGSF
jgi:hypothetical protein